MAEQITVARPYAEAVFRLAREKNSFSGWSKALEAAAIMVADPQARSIIHDPRYSAAQLKEFLGSVLGNYLDEEGKSLLNLLVDNDRVVLLPEISELFERLRAEHEGVMNAAITSAFPMTEAQTGELVAALESKYQRRVSATVTVDPELIGGVRIVIGDINIDASIRGRLQGMAQSLKR
jgi:F-type H+-transporting ATPase subunit delta